MLKLKLLAALAVVLCLGLAGMAYLFVSDMREMTSGRDGLTSSSAALARDPYSGVGVRPASAASAGLPGPARKPGSQAVTP